jgi:HEAT repeat protein
MRFLGLLGLLLVASCEAPRASETPRAPEPPPAVAPPAEVPEMPAPPAVDPALRAKLEQLLIGGGYVPDAATLKGLGKGVFEALSSIAEDEGSPLEVRARALASLSYLDDPRVSTELVQALSGRNSLLTRTALFGLARVKGVAAVPQIAPFLSDPNATVRLAAAEALGRIGGGSARLVLQQRLGGETDPSVRDALARALAKSNP